MALAFKSCIWVVKEGGLEVQGSYPLLYSRFKISLSCIGHCLNKQTTKNNLNKNKYMLQ